VAMQMHRVTHVGRDSESDSNSFAALYIQRLAIWVGSLVDRPDIGGHVSAKRCR
jgi:hypothetical protein